MRQGINANTISIARKLHDTELSRIIREEDKERRLNKNVDSEIERLFKQREQYEKELEIARDVNDLERELRALRTLEYNEKNLQKCLVRKAKIVLMKQAKSNENQK